MQNLVTVYVQLLNEGVLSYRSADAILIRDDMYSILLSENYDPNDEDWEFKPGAIVRCQNKELSDGIALVAVDRVNISECKSDKNQNSKTTYLWIFTGNASRFPSAVFESQQDAQSWISKESISGTLTKYPVGIPVYDWALSNNYFKIKDKIISPNFIANFSSASQEHFHFADGRDL